MGKKLVKFACVIIDDSFDKLAELNDCMYRAKSAGLLGEVNIYADEIQDKIIWLEDRFSEYLTPEELSLLRKYWRNADSLILPF